MCVVCVLSGIGWFRIVMHYDALRWSVVEEATSKLAADSCEKANAELARSLQEDPTCQGWPALKAGAALRVRLSLECLE